MIVSNALSAIKTARCGVIPYTILKRDSEYKIWFLLARDRLTKELGDFGGGVRKDEYSLMAGMREFSEETHGVFSRIYTSPNDLANKLALIDTKKSTMAVIFVPLEEKWIMEAQKQFSQTKTCKTGTGEISEMVWVDENKFFGLIYDQNYDNDQMWVRVKNFFQKNYQACNIVEVLKKLELGDLE